MIEGAAVADPDIWPAAKRLIDAIAERADWPVSLVARPAPVSGARWHANRLRAALEETEADPARAAYHARWLAHCLARDEPRYQPRVSVVIPVYNRADIIGEAIDSCLNQTYGVIEVIAVDDGSTDETPDVLAGYGDRIRVIRQENRGVSAARNAGIEAATGDYIHFLDSDDILHPDCLSRAVAAFDAVPDADLCCHRMVEIGPAGFRFSAMKHPHLDGGPACVTTDPLAAITERMPFPPSAMMVARWRALAAPRYEEDVGLGEDHRYLFTLARQGIKVCGLTDRLTLKREHADSLSSQRPDLVPTLRRARLRTLINVIEAPELWRHLPAVLKSRSIAVSLRLLDPSCTDPADAAEARRLLEAVRRYGDGERHHDLSPVVVLHLLLVATGIGRHETARDRPQNNSNERSLVGVLARSIEMAAPLTAADLSYWQAVQAPRSARNGVLTLISDKADNAHAAALDRAIRTWRGQPGSTRWAILLRLAPWLGLERAVPIAENIALATVDGGAANVVVSGVKPLRDGLRSLVLGPARGAHRMVRRIRTARAYDALVRRGGFLIDKASDRD